MKKRFKSGLIITSVLLSATTIAIVLPSIVSCSSSNNPNTSGYHITGDFAKIYTPEIYNQNLDFLSHRFDGNNQLLMNQSNQQPNPNNSFVPYIKNVQFTSLNANNDTLEISFKALVNAGVNTNVEQWINMQQTKKYIYKAPNQIQSIPTSSFDEPGQNYGNIMTNKEFTDEVYCYTNQGFDNFLKFMNAKWID